MKTLKKAKNGFYYIRWDGDNKPILIFETQTELIDFIAEKLNIDYFDFNDFYNQVNDNYNKINELIELFEDYERMDELYEGDNFQGYDKEDF